MTSQSDFPALLGGEAIRPEGPPGWPPDWADVKSAVQSALEDGSWGMYDGPHLEALRERLSRDFGNSEIVLCSSGTVAVELALRGVPITAKDEVILGGYDFSGNIQTVLALGALPVLVDIDPQSGTLDPALLADAITSKTKAVIVSHLHGGMADVAAIVEQSWRNKIAVIEDACQMPGAKCERWLAGSFGDVGVLSFGGSKLITAGRGGAIVINNNPGMAQRIRLYRIRGNNAYPLSELQAAAVLPQWQRLETDNQTRADTVQLLIDRLPKNCGLTPFTNSSDKMHPAYYKLGFWYSPDCFSGLSREIFAQAMRAEGIAIDPGFRALHLSVSKRRYRIAGELPHATRADSQVLTLHHPMLIEGEPAVAQFFQALEKIQSHSEPLKNNSQP